MEIIYQGLIGEKDDEFRIQEYVIKYAPSDMHEIECFVCGELASFIWNVFHKKSFLIQIELCEKCKNGIKELCKKIK
jgi:hypothetical protein